MSPLFLQDGMLLWPNSRLGWRVWLPLLSSCACLEIMEYVLCGRHPVATRIVNESLSGGESRGTYLHACLQCEPPSLQARVVCDRYLNVTFPPARNQGRISYSACAGTVVPGAKMRCPLSNDPHAQVEKRSVPYRGENIFVWLGEEKRRFLFVALCFPLAASLWLLPSLRQTNGFM